MAERWLVEFGRLRVRVDEFAWRKEALACHDLHHELTGYAHSPTGEMEIAAWEFAAGPYASPWAYLMCLPLVGAGLLLIPRRTFAAFVTGRRSVSLYGMKHALHLPEPRLRELVLPATPPKAGAADVAGFALLAVIGLAVLFSPLVPLILLFASPEFE